MLNFNGTKCAGKPVGAPEVLGNTTTVCSGSPGYSYFTWLYSSAVGFPTGSVTTYVNISRGHCTRYLRLFHFISSHHSSALNIRFFTSPTSCATGNGAKLFSGLVGFISGTCGADPARSNDSLAVAAACGVPTTTVRTTLLATQSISGGVLSNVTATVAQTATFKRRFASAVAATLGVAASTVTVTGVTSKRGSGSGSTTTVTTTVAYSLFTPVATVPMAFTVLANSGTALGGYLNNYYGAVTVSTPVVYNLPTGQPTQQPTVQPSRQPSARPSRQPTRRPTSQPSEQPTGTYTYRLY